MRTFKIPQTEIVIQPEVKGSGTEVTISSVMDDGGCVIASWNFAGKSFTEVLWDENSTPTYTEIGTWSDESVNNRITEFLNK